VLKHHQFVSHQTSGVRHSFEHAGVHDVLHRVTVLGPFGVLLLGHRDPPLALGLSGRGVVIAEAGCAPEHHQEKRDAEGDVLTPSHGAEGSEFSGERKSVYMTRYKTAYSLMS
jgi:hypothetical protein